MDEKVLKLIAEALKAFSTADHLAFVTYPLLQDPRLMLVMAQNIDRALTGGMNALLHLDVYRQQIRVLPMDMQSRMQLFEEYTARQHHIPKSVVQSLREVKGILQKHAESPVEFTRNGRLIICDDAYQMRILDMDRVKGYLAESRTLMRTLEEVKMHV